MCIRDRGKLVPTDVGTVVSDFLLQYFPEIMDYNFTAEVEKKFDDIAEGKTEWTQMMKDFYGDFEPEVEKTLNAKSEHKVGERLLGTDPQSGKPVFVKIGRFGPVVQIGTAEDLSLIHIYFFCSNHRNQKNFAWLYRYIL